MDGDELSSFDEGPDDITEIHSLPARGLAAMEQIARLFHVVNARPGTGAELTQSFGPRRTLLVDGGISTGAMRATVAKREG